MVTPTQLTQFFTSGTQMGLTDIQRRALANEGLSSIDDFEDFKSEELYIAFKNVRSGIPGTPMVGSVAAVVNAAGNITEPAIPAILAVAGVRSVPIPAKSSSRLLVASVAYHYYQDTGRAITAGNMHFNNVLRDFNMEYQAIRKTDKLQTMKLPALTAANPPLQWCESFRNFLYTTFGVRKIPLLYVVRESVAVIPEGAPPATPAVAADPNAVYDPLLPNKSYGSSGSILEDTIYRSSHSHPLFKTDNATVYTYIEESTRGSIYATTIKPFARKKDGRGAMNAIVASHLGVDKWERIQKENSSWLMSAKWNGKRTPLETYISSHRAKHQQLEEAALHIPFQVPNSQTRVGYLLDNILNSDAALQAAIASIRQNTNDMRGDFEAAVSVLLPVDPYVRNHATRKPVSFEVSTLIAKNGRGTSTGVDLRWYKLEEYRTLSDEEKKELSEWQRTKDGKKKISSGRDTYFNNKRKRLSGGKPEKDREPTPKQRKKRDGQTARIAALEKQLKDQTKVAELAAVFKDAGTISKQTVAIHGGANETLARKVMAIVARKSADDG